MIVNHIHKKWYFLRSQILPLTPTGHTSSWKCKILYYIEPNLTQNVGVHFSICGGGEGGRLAPESNRNFFKCDIFEINHKEIILQEKLKMFNIMGWIPFKGWNTFFNLLFQEFQRKISWYIKFFSVSDPYHFDLDPDPDPR